MSLRVYNRKRKFTQTSEPKGKRPKSSGGPLRFVVQLHAATRLHYDFRIEMDGVFKSWAIPKGPSLNPQDQRLAVFVEDHPLEYGSFEGIIPKGNYGAGTVMVWDAGTYQERGSKNRAESAAAMRRGLEKGHLTFVLDGEKLKGEFALVRLKKDAANKAWLLIKKRDEFSTIRRQQMFNDLSVQSGRSMAEITQQATAQGKVWLPKRSVELKKSKVHGPTRTDPQIGAPRLDVTTLKKPQQTSEPMPRKIKPMLATASRHEVTGDSWIFEPHQDGLRALAEVEGKNVHLYSKSGLPFAKRFPEIVNALQQLQVEAAFDGEIIKSGAKSVYAVFDILYSAGKDLRQRPLRERRQILQKVLKPGKHLALTQTSEKSGTGTQVAKNLASTYHSGTSADWLIVTKEKTSKRAATTASAEPRLTNLDKIYFPSDGYSKGDILDYYQKIAPYILPYLKDRPESLNRQPNGIGAPGFYQKDMTGHIPRWLTTERIFSESADKSIDYVVCQDLRSLLYLVNLGCIEINPWFSRVGHLDSPDFLVIDLDPDNNPFAHVIEVALYIHKILTAIGAANFCKTSGATGLHIGVPVGARYTFDQVRSLAEEICRIVAKKWPSTTSVERNPQRRRGKIYLDYMQNRRGQTLAAPFCVRPHPGAPVSMPVSWKDLQKGLKPQQFHIKNALRLAPTHNQHWRPILEEPISLEKCVKNLHRTFKA